MKRKVFIECTHTFHSEINTGIQRVVRNIVRNAEEIQDEVKFEISPVIFDDGNFYTVNTEEVLSRKKTHQEKKDDWGFVLSQNYQQCKKALIYLLPFSFWKRFLYAPKFEFGLSWLIYKPYKIARKLISFCKNYFTENEIKSPITLDNLNVKEGDILLLLDSSWVLPIWPAVNRFKSRGGKVAGVIYDMIPISHKATIADPSDLRFAKWLKAHIKYTDTFYTISKTVALDLINFLENSDCVFKKNAPVSYFYLGSELDFKTDEPIDENLQNLFPTGIKNFLVVGSIEPRKNHKYILDAFDSHWASGGEAQLIIVGGSGWNNNETIQRINFHPLKDKKLFLLREVSDSALEFCYQKSSALIIASIIEGFGLPIVEAFQRGLPVLCSDIPIFREIAEGKASFFNLSNSEHLTFLIDKFFSENQDDIVHKKCVGWISWKESTRRLFNLIDADFSTRKGNI